MSNIIHTNEQANYLSDAFLAKEAYKTFDIGDIVTDSFGTWWGIWC